MDNFEYVVQNVKDEKIADIYRQLGPYDHYANRDPLADVDINRAMKLDFDARKSGALYKGQISIASGKPDGYGFKIYPNNSMYEGSFDEGQIHGMGRGVSSKGEVYQGEFAFDQMDGKGLFQWPDGRAYFGQFKEGQKQGKGMFMWPNG